MKLFWYDYQLYMNHEIKCLWNNKMIPYAWMDVSPIFHFILHDVVISKTTP
jgi:hypothetical protein